LEALFWRATGTIVGTARSESHLPSAPNSHTHFGHGAVDGAPSLVAAAELLRTEREGKRTHARVVRHQRQHVVSSRRTRDQANHARPIEVCHSIRADVLKLLCDWFRQNGHQCATQMVAEMPHAHVEVEQFISEHKPGVPRI
jgi:hypothetical protein